MRRMKRRILFAVVMVFFVVSAMAQTTDPQLPQIPDGQLIWLKCPEVVGSKFLKVGDTIQFRVAKTVLLNDKVLLRDDTLLLARVTDAQSYSEKGTPARLGFRVEEARIGKKSIPLNAYIYGNFQLPSITRIGINMSSGSSQPPDITPGRSGLPNGMSLKISSTPDVGPEIISAESDIRLEPGWLFMVRQTPRRQH